MGLHIITICFFFLLARSALADIIKAAKRGVSKWGQESPSISVELMPDKANAYESLGVGSATH
jgi:hypothetical protein